MSIDSVEVLQDPDAPGAVLDLPAAPAPMPKLDEAGEIVKVDRLPPEFPANATAGGNGSYVLALDYPVTLKFGAADGTVKAEEYKSLTLNRMNGATYRTVTNAPQESFRAQVLVALTGLSLGRATLLEERMDAADMAAVLIIFRFFTTPGRRTGP